MLIIRVVVRFLMPFMILYGLYVQFFGDEGAGGGFQAGVICASAFIAYALSTDVESAAEIVPMRAAYRGAALGWLLYGATGVASMLRGGTFLDYDLLGGGTTGQHVGIFLVELGVGLAVFSVMLSLVYVFGGVKK
ncbi:MAG: Na(+)/H(+) antiporter subunit B [Rickettsiales bacterium]